MSQGNRAERIAEITLLFITILWGSSFVVAHFALNAALSPLFILMCRFMLSALFIGIVFYKRIRETITIAYIKSGILLGSIFFIAFYTQMLGLKYSTPSNNAIIVSANVVIVPLIWWVVTKNKPSRSIYVSCFISLIGIAVISVDVSQGVSIQLGDAFSLLSAIVFAAQIVAVGELAKRIDYILLVFIECLTAALLAMMFFLLTDTETSFHSFTNVSGMLSVLYLGIVCTCICFLLQAQAMRKVNASRGAIIMSTEALFGSLLSILVGTDILSYRVVIGGLVLFLAVMVPELQKIRLRKRSV